MQHYGNSPFNICHTCEADSTLGIMRKTDSRRKEGDKYLVLKYILSWYSDCILNKCRSFKQLG